MFSSKKSASSSTLSWTFASVLLFVGLTLTIASSSFKIVFVDAQPTTSLQELLTTTEEEEEGGAEEEEEGGAEEEEEGGAEEEEEGGAEE
jgi:hypothetical protein